MRGALRNVYADGIPETALGVGGAGDSIYTSVTLHVFCGSPLTMPQSTVRVRMTTVQGSGAATLYVNRTEPCTRGYPRGAARVRHLQLLREVFRAVYGTYVRGGSVQDSVSLWATAYRAARDNIR